MNITIILLILVLGALLLDTTILIKLSKSLDKIEEKTNEKEESS